MKNLHEITRAILTHEKEEFDKTFTLSQIKELDEMIEGNLDSTSYNYIKPDFTKYTYVALDKCQIEDLWYDSTYDANTELETEDYYIYYHNQNYKRG